MTPPACETAALAERLAGAAALRLYLDYDGTLADFAPTPDDILPDPAIAGLLLRLAQLPRTEVAIISGRRLSHIEALVPVPGILLAGTYGIELRWPDGALSQRVELAAIRPVLDNLKPRWAALIDDRQGFYLEDKSWSMALHARFADDAAAGETLAGARRLADDALQGALPGQFRILGGHKFLEIGPAQANKGDTIRFLAERDPQPGALPVYIGDDDKDEEAFAVINALGGQSFVVAAADRPSLAACRFSSPAAVRQFLHALAKRRSPSPV
ncbi:MAG: trehalose-phosphatase [Caldilineales bacterium]